MKLDRKQPFGTICGDAEGRVYEQNHKFYGSDDREIHSVDAPETANVVKAKKAAKVETPVDDQLAAQMGAV